METLQRIQQEPHHVLAWLLSSEMRALCFCTSNTAAKVASISSRGEIDGQELLRSIAECSELTHLLIAELNEPVFDLPSRPPSAKAFELHVSHS